MKLTTVDLTIQDPTADSVRHLIYWIDRIRRMGHIIIINSAFHAAPNGRSFLLQIEARFVDAKAAAWFKTLMAC